VDRGFLRPSVQLMETIGLLLADRYSRAHPGVNAALEQVCPRCKN